LALRPGCDAARLAVVPVDPSAPGRFAVGLSSGTAYGLAVDVYYPATPGAAGAGEVVRDLAEALPTDRAGALGGSLPGPPLRCSRDLALDADHGPYPVVVYLHGLSLYRFAHATLLVHLASRGFVVIAPDLPGATLADVIAARPRTDEAEKVAPLLAGLAAPEGALRFLAGHLAPDRLGLVGHSLGGEVASRLGARFGQVIVSMAERGIAPARRRFLAVIVGGLSDGIEPWRRQREGYATSPRPRRLIGIAGAGHMSFSDVCSVWTQGGGWHAAAMARGLSLGGFPARLAARGCAEPELAPDRAQAVIRAVVTAPLEEVLTCTAPPASQGAATWPEVTVWRRDDE
jgi:predicted dienelactone hydrolase